MIQLNPDLVNGCIEFNAALFIANNAWQVWKDKQYKGVSLISTSFFTGWGGWNLYYYPHLNQALSFSGGVAVVLMNCTWLGLMWKFRKSKTTTVTTSTVAPAPTNTTMTFDEICEVIDKIPE